MEILSYIDQYVESSIAKQKLQMVINQPNDYQVSEDALNEYKRQEGVVLNEIAIALEGYLSLITEMNIVEMHAVADALVTKVLTEKKEISLIHQSKYSLKKNRKYFQMFNGAKKYVDVDYNYSMFALELEIIEHEKRLDLLNTMISDVNNRILKKGEFIRSR